ncbi:MAG: Ppx/GppA phosphatase family protein [Actinomycetota bacterium]|nr:Ppx/GppA phosphatase family protein [Actinomycetota bacterium]
MTTVAAIDCGTNSVRLLVADLAPDGSVSERARLMRIVRLGEGVDRTGAFSADALDRTFTALDEYAAVLAREAVEQVRFVATSASRDVSNRDAFAAGVLQRVGVLPEVISGEEEAALSFLGALRGLPAGAVRPPALVVDIGGGSTEFVRGSAAVDSAVSVDIGCVRMTERHLHADPPTAAEVAAAHADISAEVRRADGVIGLAGARTMVGLAGSVTTVAAMALGMERYDAAVLHGSLIGVDQVADAADRLTAMTRSERSALPYMHPGRVDVIAAGAMILREAMLVGRYSEVRVSETDILDGIVYRFAQL